MIEVAGGIILALFIIPAVIVLLAMVVPYLAAYLVLLVLIGVVYFFAVQISEYSQWAALVFVSLSFIAPWIAVFWIMKRFPPDEKMMEAQVRKNQRERCLKTGKFIKVSK